MCTVFSGSATKSANSIKSLEGTSTGQDPRSLSRKNISKNTKVSPDRKYLQCAVDTFTFLINIYYRFIKFFIKLNII